jgi:hypothetical protein
MSVFILFIDISLLILIAIVGISFITTLRKQWLSANYDRIDHLVYETFDPGGWGNQPYTFSRSMYQRLWAIVSLRT